MNERRNQRQSKKSNLLYNFVGRHCLVCCHHDHHHDSQQKQVVILFKYFLFAFVNGFLEKLCAFFSGYSLQREVVVITKQLLDFFCIVV